MFIWLACVREISNAWSMRPKRNWCLAVSLGLSCNTIAYKWKINMRSYIAKWKEWSAIVYCVYNRGFEVFALRYTRVSRNYRSADRCTLSGDFPPERPEICRIGSNGFSLSSLKASIRAYLSSERDSRKNWKFSLFRNNTIVYSKQLLACWLAYNFSMNYHTGSFKRKPTKLDFRPPSFFPALSNTYIQSTLRTVNSHARSCASTKRKIATSAFISLDVSSFAFCVIWFNWRDLQIALRTLIGFRCASNSSMQRGAT